MSVPIRIAYIGGPTAIIGYGGLSFVTDPTFDPAPTNYANPAYTLRKTRGPAQTPPEGGFETYVLLSHDHHFDNLDRRGRQFLSRAKATFTTKDGAARLGGGADGLQAWDARELPTPAGTSVLLTATPARHGPANGDRGPVIGFVLATADGSLPSLYFSGDTVWYEGIEEVIRRFPIRYALLNLGAAKVQVAGPSPLTFTAAEAVQFAKACPRATILPLHFDGWTHFSEGETDIRSAFAKAGLEDRLRWLPPGEPTDLIAG